MTIYVEKQPFPGEEVDGGNIATDGNWPAEIWVEDRLTQRQVHFVDNGPWTHYSGEALGRYYAAEDRYIAVYRSQWGVS